MIEVKLTLYTPWELAIIHEGMSIIHKARESQMTPPASAEDAADVAAAKEALAEPGPNTPLEQVIATITPAGVTKSGPNIANITTPEIEVALTELAPMKYDAVEAAMHAALKAHGTPKTREILESYVTDGKRVKDLDPAVWPEIVARLEAGQ